MWLNGRKFKEMEGDSELMDSIVSSTLLFAAKSHPPFLWICTMTGFISYILFIKCRCLHSKFCCIRVVNPSSHISNSSSPVYLLPRMPAEVARNRHKERGKHLNKYTSSARSLILKRCQSNTAGSTTVSQLHFMSDVTVLITRLTYRATLNYI